MIQIPGCESLPIPGTIADILLPHKTFNELEDSFFIYSLLVTTNDRELKKKYHTTKISSKKEKISVKLSQFPDFKFMVSVK